MVATIPSVPKAGGAARPLPPNRTSGTWTARPTTNVAQGCSEDAPSSSCLQAHLAPHSSRLLEIQWGMFISVSLQDLPPVSSAKCSCRTVEFSREAEPSGIASIILLISGTTFRTPCWPESTRRERGILRFVPAPPGHSVHSAFPYLPVSSAVS